jgi:hypothetical protein
MASLRLVALAVAVVLVAPTPQKTMSFTIHSRELQTPVEQQTPGGEWQPDRSLWVINPTDGTTSPALWDADDSVRGMFSGALARGESFSWSQDVILDRTTHLVGLLVTDGLAGTITVSPPVHPEWLVAVPGAGTFAATDATRRACLFTPEYGVPEHVGLPEIPGSNGGHGDRVTVTWTLRNIAGRKLMKAGGSIIIRVRDAAAAASWGCG